VRIGERLEAAEGGRPDAAYERVEPAEGAPCLRGESVSARAIGEVGGGSRGLRAGGADGRRHRIQPGLLTSPEHQPRALAGQGHGRGLPDAAARAGDRDALPAKSEIHGQPFQISRSSRAVATTA
jgi:hypothetical protein